MTGSFKNHIQGVLKYVHINCRLDDFFRDASAGVEWDGIAEHTRPNDFDACTCRKFQLHGGAKS
jgi:hypothetical protein